jgi:hypothetical protein
MSTYLQWARGGKLRQVTWVCGPEAVLARLVVAAHREGAAPEQRLTLFAGDALERDIWDTLLSVPSSGGRRAVVYGAEKLKVPARVQLLAEAAELETSYTVFVSSADDFAPKGTDLPPHLAALQKTKTAQLIRCCAPSSPEDRVALVAGWWPGASPNFAHALLTRCGSLERAWQACEQARLAGLEPSPAMAAVVCPSEPGGDFADLLMAGNRRGAAAVLPQLGRGELGAVIGLLSWRLAAAEQIAAAVRPGVLPREAAAVQHVDRYVASRVIPHLGAYGTDRIRRCRRLLAQVDAAWRSGAQGGLAESLVALW